MLNKCILIHKWKNEVSEDETQKPIRQLHGNLKPTEWLQEILTTIMVILILPSYAWLECISERLSSLMKTEVSHNSHLEELHRSKCKYLPELVSFYKFFFSLSPYEFVLLQLLYRSSGSLKLEIYRSVMSGCSKEEKEFHSWECCRKG